MKNIGIIWVFCCSLLLAACGNNPSASHSAHNHAMPKPTLNVEWKVEGSSLIIDVSTDMHISPEHYGQARKMGEGHIHMYLDHGEKIAVKEGHKEFHDLPSGSHTLKVSLHNNDHTPYDVTKTINFDIP